MEYVLFERNPAIPAGLGFTLCCLAFALAMAGLAWGRRKPVDAQPPMLRFAASLLTGPARVIGIALLLALLGAIQPAWKFWELRQALQSGSMTVVEGNVVSARAWYQSSSRSTGNRIEAFQVGSVPPRTFEYRENEVGSPYPLLADNGGVLKPGKPVRVTLAGDAIVKVETDNACRVYPRCSRFGWGSFSWESERK
ncbi:MAG: hypothetical protein JNN20_13740 [Betaproteobacteria bacterium]|nr:hypothetical protein [Betaproteobacteria bacterium]